MPSHARRRWFDRFVASRQARRPGRLGSSGTRMSDEVRCEHYRAQSGNLIHRLTPAQARRARHKNPPKETRA